jgi:LPXTG-motif cell wall-anchored protein
MRRWIAVPTLAGVLMLGTATVADAQKPTQDESANEDDNDNVGLLGLIGLAGLAGLAGLKRRDRNTRYDQRASSYDQQSSTRTP